MLRFKDFTYRTLKSWSRRRRVIGKAEDLPKGPNPRFVLTSLSKKTIDARQLYEQTYCARGDMENRIKDSRCTCLPTGPPATACAPISCACGSRRSRIRC